MLYLCWVTRNAFASFRDKSHASRALFPWIHLQFQSHCNHLFLSFILPFFILPSLFHRWSLIWSSSDMQMPFKSTHSTWTERGESYQARRAKPSLSISSRLWWIVLQEEEEEELERKRVRVNLIQTVKWLLTSQETLGEMKGWQWQKEVWY